MAAAPGCHLSSEGNNRAENSHQPTRRRERIMKRFKSPRQVQRVLSIHDPIPNAFSRRPNQDTAAKFRAAPSPAFAIWVEITGVAMAGRGSKAGYTRRL